VVFLAALTIIVSSLAATGERAKMPSDTRQDGAVTLTCQPLREGDTLVFPYQITNGGRADIYVMDAVAEWDADANKVHLNTNSVVIAQASDGFAHIMKGIAPLPPGRSVAVRVIPLAAKVSPGGTLERRLEVGLPLHETDPYHPDLPVRQYRQREIAGIVLTVQYLSAAVVGFAAVPSDVAPGLFRVMAQDTVGQVAPASCRYPSRGLTILQRTDDFPRPK
jgi:hypothetical protein